MFILVHYWQILFMSQSYRNDICDREKQYVCVQRAGTVYVTASTLCKSARLFLFSVAWTLSLNFDWLLEFSFVYFCHFFPTAPAVLCISRYFLSWPEHFDAAKQHREAAGSQQSWPCLKQKRRWSQRRIQMWLYSPQLFCINIKAPGKLKWEL